MPLATRKKLLDDEATFLVEQLQNEHLRILLVNGRGVINHLRACQRPPTGAKAFSAKMRGLDNARAALNAYARLRDSK